jgi:phage terminase large subunit-like protein
MALLFDELATWRRAQETYDNSMMGLRLGKRPLTIIATTPRPTKLLRDLVAREGKDVIISRGTSFENAANLAPQYFSHITARYAGTRIGKQELEGILLDDIPGALWTITMLDDTRRDTHPELQRVVVAIDPAISTKEKSDETGIIVAGKDDRGHGYILEDLSGKFAPVEWARIAISAYHRHGADRIIAERNQGGDMVETTLRTVDPNVPYSSVVATRGKYTRAEPISALFEQNRAHIVGSMPELEDQLLQFVPDMDRHAGSPDRADAAIWAISELCVDLMPYQGLFDWYEAEKTKAARPAASASQETAPNVVYPIFGAHEGEPAVLFPTRAPGGGIRWVSR